MFFGRWARLDFFRIVTCFGHACRELAENLPSHAMPVSIADLLRPHDVRPRSSKGGGAAVVPPRGFQLNKRFHEMNG